MSSLVEIRNINEIYIHYLHHQSSEADTSDLAESIESQDNGGGEVTINNCAVTLSPLSVLTSDIAVQVDIIENLLPQSKEEHEKTARTSTKSIGGFF